MQDHQVPIVVGVTGHRYLRDVDLSELRDRVRAVFAQVATNFPDSPIEVLSPLALGADRLVAETALEWAAGWTYPNGAHPRVELTVTLPFEEALYVRDFEGDLGSEGSSLPEYLRLKAKARNVMTVPLVPGNRPDAIARFGTERNFQYAAVGAYIVRHSHVLIALYDDEKYHVDGRKPTEGEAKKVGGTGYVMDLARRGVPPLFLPHQGSLLDESVEILPNEPCFVFEIRAFQDFQKAGKPDHAYPSFEGANELSFVPDDRARKASRPWRIERDRLNKDKKDRTSASELLQSDAQWKLHTGNKGAGEFLWWERWLPRAGHWDRERDLSRWNVHLYRELPSFAALVGLNRYNFDLVDVGQPVASETGGRQRVRDHQDLADALAVKFKKLRDRVVTFNLVAGVVGVVSLNMFFFLPDSLGGFVPDDVLGLVTKGGLGLFLLVSLVGFALFARVRSEQWEARFQDYRSLAEALRVQGHWIDAGVPHGISDHFPNRLDGVQGWVRKLSAYLEIPIPAEVSRMRAEGYHRLEERKREVRDRWIADQERWLHGKIVANLKVSPPMLQVGFVLLALVLVLGLAAYAGLYFPRLVAEFAAGETTRFVKLGSFLLNVFLGMGGAFRLYSASRAHEELAAQYESSLAIYSKTGHLLDKCLELAIAARSAGAWTDHDRKLVEVGIPLSAPDPAAAVDDKMNRLLTELGQEVLAENSIWLMLQRSREIPLPKYTR